MINFKFDDKTDIERKLLDNYANQENPEETIRDLARYNHHILGMKKEDNYDAILAYMKKNCRDFYEEQYFKTIYRNIASAKKYKFRNVAPVKITQAEIDKIIGQNDIRKEKIAFTLLAVAKYYNNVSPDNNNRMYMSMSDLFKLARVAIPSKERATYLSFAYENDILVEHTFVGTNLKIVGFVNDNSETVIELNEADYKELAYAYLNYKNGGYKHCKNCGRLFKMRKYANKQLYCRECGRKEGTSEFECIKCIDCGVEVIINKFDTKTCRCEDCQKNADYAPIGEKIKVCANCSMEFVASSKSKTDLCEKCYTMHRRRRKTEVMSDLRNK
jgi:ribosomal protein L20A (L18A)